MAGIDAFLQEWDVHEVHSVVVEAPSERVLETALAIPAAPDFVVRGLLGLRGLRSGGSIEDLLGAIGLEPLARTPKEVVFGGAGKPWHARAPLGPFADPPPGTVRIAANFLVETLPDGRTRLSTETRVSAVDEAARRAFRRYWRLVSPFSALIRRRWLAAARRALS